MAGARELPEHPVLRELAEAIEQHGVSGELLDDRWRIVFTSSELLEIVDLDVEDTTKWYGMTPVIRQQRLPELGATDPVSSAVSFELFARPGLRKLAGRAEGDLVRPAVRAVAGEALGRRADGRVEFRRVVSVVEDGAHVVRSAGGQGSHHLTAMAHAHGLLPLADGPGVSAGDPVRVLLLADV